MPPPPNIWQEKAATLAQTMTFSGDGSSFSRSQGLQAGDEAGAGCYRLAAQSNKDDSPAARAGIA